MGNPDCQEFSTTLLLGLARIFRDCIQQSVDVDTSAPLLSIVRQELDRRESEDITHILTMEREHMRHILRHCSPILIQQRARDRQVQLTWPLSDLERQHELWIQEVYGELLHQEEPEPERVPVLS